MTYTSLKFSKLLAENGCKLEDKMYHRHLINPMDAFDLGEYFIVDKEKGLDSSGLYPDYPAYDILNDLCVKYAKEMFGEGTEYANKFEFCSEDDEGLLLAYQFYSREILFLLQLNKTQEAEDYIWEHCKFNPKNK